jgi:hypothetical protein
MVSSGGRIALLCFAAALSGCGQNPLTKVSELERTVAEQNARIEDLAKKLKDAELKLFFLELSKDSYKTATFDPAADEGFSRIDTSVGTLAVAIREVKPHADGVKVRLHVGNLTSATVSGGKFKAKWGPRMSKVESGEWQTTYVQWQKKLHEQESNFTQELRPGTWNNLTLTLPGVPPEQFGYLELSLDTSQIKLFVSK